MGGGKYFIINELILAADSFEELKDFKFFCFNGVPKFLKVDFGRFTDHHANYYDLDWNLLSYVESCYPPDQDRREPKPHNFDEMLNIAATLSKNFTFVRVDLYNVMGKIYFGELTLYPSSGFTPWGENQHDIELGKMLMLPQ